MVLLEDPDACEVVRTEEIEALDDGARAPVLLRERERRVGGVGGDLAAQQRLNRVEVGQGDEVVVECPRIAELLLGRLADEDGLYGVRGDHGDLVSRSKVFEALKAVVVDHQRYLNIGEGV